MSEAVQVAIIIAIPPTLIGVLNFIQGRKNVNNIEELKISVDGHMTKLLALTKEKATVAGIKQGKAEK